MKYVRRSGYGIEVDGLEKNGSLMGYLNKLCEMNLSTFDGRLNASKKILGRTRNVPVFVSENTILFSSGNIRNYDCVFINYFRVLKVLKEGKNTLILFDDLTSILVKNDYEKMVKNYLLAKEIRSYYERKESVYTGYILIDLLI